MGPIADRLLSNEKTPEADLRFASGNLHRDRQTNSHPWTVFYCPASSTCVLRRFEALV